jgi:hypothetical protein
VEEVMVAEMDQILHPDLDADHPERVRVEVDAKIVGTWGG